MLVQAQLRKESQVRQRVVAIKTDLERGLHLVRALANANVDQFRLYISAIASLLVRGALGRGPALVGKLAFDTYIVRTLLQLSRAYR